MIVTAIPTGSRPTPGLRAATERLLRELNPDRPPVPRNLEAVLADPAARLVVAIAYEADRPADWQALEEAEFLGMLTITFRNSLTRRVAHLDHVAVDARHQRRGIARAMIEHAAELARAAGASRIDLTSAAGRQAAAHLYPSLGFQRRETVNWRRSL